ncbi:MAG: hypothetical protein IPL20_17800 [Saprospiraceae bacterium]|nr:hypothetical protein [Saprospiraceae bacterium]
MATLQPYIPSSEKPWDKKKRAIHLLRRLGLGGTPASIASALAEIH